MAKIRVNKSKDYVVMSNYHLRETKMSLKAKGLLSQMLSLPDDWDYSIKGLATINKESENTIKLTLDELKKFRYLVVTKRMPNETESGRIEYIYDIYERPFEQKQGTQKQGVEFQGVENSLQLNIDILNIDNNKKENNKKKKTYFENEEVNNIFVEFLEQRKKMKAVNSDRAIGLLIKKLNQYDDDIKIKMIEQSILNSWKGVFELKKGKKEDFITRLDKWAEKEEK